MGEDNMFRNKKNSEKSERKKAAGAQARQAADEKLQELKVEGGTVTGKSGDAPFYEPLFDSVPRAVILRGVLRDRVGIAAFVPQSVQLCGRQESGSPLIIR